MKKFLATMLALVMALTLCATAWGEGETSMTLNVNGSVETSATERAEGATFKTVQEAIDKAQAGDTIQIAAGTYEVFIVNKALTIIGTQENGENKTTIKTLYDGLSRTIPSSASGETGGIAIYYNGGAALNGGEVAFKNLNIVSYGVGNGWYYAPICDINHMSGALYNPSTISIENCAINYSGAAEGCKLYAVLVDVSSLIVTGCKINGFSNGIANMSETISAGEVKITNNEITVESSPLSGNWIRPEGKTGGTFTITRNQFTATGDEPATVTLLDYANEQGQGSMFGSLTIKDNTATNVTTVIAASTGNREDKIINPTVENGKVTSGIFNFNPVGEGVTLGGVELHNDPILASSTNSDNETSYYFGAQNIATAATDNGNVTVVRGGNEVITVPAGTTVSIANNVEKVQVNGNDMTSGSTTTFYTVTFKNGDDDVETKTVASGSTVTAPAAPTNGSKIFDGWYVVNADGTKKAWDFTKDTVTNNMTLTAQWHTRVRINSTTTTTDTTETKAESPKTFDAGVAVYGLMAVSSVLGMGVVGKKKF